MLPLLGLILGGVCLSLTPGYINNSNRASNYPQDVTPGVSDEYYESQQPREQATGREEIAYLDERDRDIHQRANRQGDWGYKQNWRYDRKAFYSGETQGEAYDKEHPDGVGGPGMDPDTEYLQMRKFYMEDAKRNRQNAADQRNNAASSYTNSQNNPNRTNNREIGNQSKSYYQPAYPSYNPNYNNPNSNYPSGYNPNGYPTNESYYQSSGYYYQ
jgi:hypothetical protein